MYCSYISCNVVSFSDRVSCCILTKLWLWYFSDINGDWSYEVIKRIDHTNESALDSVKERISDHDHDVPPEPAHLLLMKINTAGRISLCSVFHSTWAIFSVKEVNSLMKPLDIQNILLERCQSLIPTLRKLKMWSKLGQ